MRLSQAAALCLGLLASTAAMGVEDSNSQRTVQPTPAALWFWPDPFPHLGHDESKGRDWLFARIAGDRQAMSPIKTSARQHIEIETIVQVAIEQAGAANEAVDWEALREEAEALLSKEQVARIEQLIVQRLGYQAFLDPDVVQRLQISEKQREDISSYVDQYRFLVRDNEAELGRSKFRAAEHLNGDKLARRISDLTAQKAARDDAFLLQLWSGIDDVLSEQQRQEFSLLRGPMPESLREILPKLNGNPGFMRDGDFLTYRRRAPMPPTAQAVDINPPSNQDAQLAWLELMHDNGNEVNPREARKLLIIKNKLVDHTDPPCQHPMNGLARLHHSHYKCTIWSGEDEVDVVYLDRSHFHGVVAGEYDAQCELREQVIRIPIE